MNLTERLLPRSWKGAVLALPALLAVLAVILLWLRTGPATVSGDDDASPSATTAGDVNSDGVVDEADASLILQYYAGATSYLPNSDRADVNGDGSNDSRDALLIQQLAVGLIDTLPPPSISIDPLSGTGTPLPATTLRVTSTTAPVGSKGTVVVEVLNMPPPGLGAWGMNITYDPSAAAAQSCVGQNGSVCNPFFDADGIPPDAVRLGGATAFGLEGDAKLGSFTFRCDDAGISALTITDLLFADATIGNPQPIKPLIENGTLTCEPAGPPEINIHKIGQYDLPKTCFDVRDDLQNPLFVVCDNDFQGAPDVDSVCVPDGVCEDEDPADGLIRVTVQPGDYHVVEVQAAPHHIPDQSKPLCAAVVNQKCELTFVSEPETNPWFPWDVFPTDNPNGAVTIDDIFDVMAHFGWQKFCTPNC